MVFILSRFMRRYQGGFVLHPLEPPMKRSSGHPILAAQPFDVPAIQLPLTMNNLIDNRSRSDIRHLTLVMPMLIHQENHHLFGRRIFRRTHEFFDEIKSLPMVRLRANIQNGARSP